MKARQILEEVLAKFGHLSQEVADYCAAEVAKLEAEDAPAVEAAPEATPAPAAEEAPATEAAPATDSASAS